MKKAGMIILLIAAGISITFAGGLVVNTNQSAEFVRTMNRNATTELDAAYFNPAGLTKLSDGFHLYISNQTILQNRTVYVMTDTTYEGGDTLLPQSPILYNKDSYEGTTFAPVFPSVHMAYKTGNMAASGSFMPVGGGGSADFPEGLPAFENTLAGTKGLPAYFVASVMGHPTPHIFMPYGSVEGYSLDAAFVGSSIYLGFQGNVAGTINDMISISAGVRYIYAKNEYEGHLRDITLITSSSPADTIDNTITSEQIPYLGNKEVKAMKTGSTYTGIFGLNITPFDGLNIGLKYETYSKLQLTNDTEADSVNLYPDGAVSNDDIPAFLAAGISYQATPKLRLEGSFNYYWNKGLNWYSGAEVIPLSGGEEDTLIMSKDPEEFLDDGYEGGLAVEYSVNEKLQLSAGFLYNFGGAKNTYNSDLDFSMPTSTTVGLGARYFLSPKMALSVGFLDVFYEEAKNDKIDTPDFERYGKTTVDVAVGFQYSF